MITQIAFKDRLGQVIVAKFDNNKVLLSNGEIITESANAHRRRTQKGNNLKINPITKKNWERATVVFCDKTGFSIRVPQIQAERMDFDNPPQPKTLDTTPFAWIENIK